MTRSFAPLASLLAAILIWAGGSNASAQTHPTLAPSFVVADGDGNGNDDEDHGDRQVRARNAGSIDGEVTSVDYRTNRMSVRAGGTNYDVTVLPSTDFRGRTNSFHGITDIKRGEHVSVMLSQRAQTLTAQIIHLR
ncbi:MAG: hypothetical protein NVS2B8_07580 [Vulcanimicrobiaceae bacterium]